MDLGLLTLGDHLTDPVTGARQTQAERHRGLVEQAVVAERSGFTSVHLGEHHFCDYILSAPPIVLAAIAERTGFAHVEYLSVAFKRHTGINASDFRAGRRP